MNLIGSQTLETERLILRRSNMEEQKCLWEILMIPEVNKWYLVSGKKHANEPEYWKWDNQEKFYKYKVENANNTDVFGWSIFLKPEYTDDFKEKVIGQITEQEKSDDIFIRDVGWYIDPTYWNRGYAYEAASAMLKYMFEKVEIDKIESCAVKENFGSCRLFEKLGFEKTGEVTHESDYTFYDGILIYSLYQMNKKLYFENKKVKELKKE